ncbi:MAG: SxtJ family membrane protein, partial [Planctomycetota bacterium]
MTPPPDRTQLRRFGLLVGGIFAALAAYSLVRHAGSTFGWAAAVVGGALLLFGLLAPAGLRAPHRAWMLLGHVLGWINTRVILGVVFYAGFTLTRLYLALRRRDPLQRAVAREGGSYW